MRHVFGEIRYGKLRIARGTMSYGYVIARKNFTAHVAVRNPYAARLRQDKIPRHYAYSKFVIIAAAML